MKFPELETDRLYLIEIGKQHAESLFDILSREEVTRYGGIETLLRLEESQRIIHSFRSSYINERGIQWGMVLKDTGRFIGTVGLNHLNKSNKRAEIGYEVHPDYRRKYYTWEAVREVLRFSFHELELHRIAAMAFPHNMPSTNLLKKVGFQEEGTLRNYLYFNKESQDVRIFSLLNSEYSALNSGSLSPAFYRD
ncbi:GNAT family N-acetyltransferase [Peribacillus sp. NPDC097264]|uniref:GNAT family N-acetyltransferase n=1 Tax=Peribacillus sp. NPDC097264 TaxID=3390616 RepID=UPI003D08116C